MPELTSHEGKKCSFILSVSTVQFPKMDTQKRHDPPSDKTERLAACFVESLVYNKGLEIFLEINVLWNDINIDNSVQSQSNSNRMVQYMRLYYTEDIVFLRKDWYSISKEAQCGQSFCLSDIFSVNAHDSK